MPQLIISGTIIEFPDTAASPDWSPAIIQFAQAVEAALSLAVGTYDVPSQAFTIDAYNSASNVTIHNLAFPTSIVRSVYIRYSIYRTTSSATAYEAGDMIAIYNANNDPGSKWILSIGNKTGNDGQITFHVSDTGQFTFDSTALSGTGHSGKIIFEAKALEQS